ncbi:hypothetical protein Trco_007467 [Trichoderma cornu-damae]|uniref:Uncharacterized protein n=1 Tax=Trichoderma cornu-damae TaxID=654480 RepID=A0A9P8QFY1_9HYPO|nr:hypothetical protein Trco_007467 [Trichoderma cornu-damae]
MKPPSGFARLNRGCLVFLGCSSLGDLTLLNSGTVFITGGRGITVVGAGGVGGHGGQLLLALRAAAVERAVGVVAGAGRRVLRGRGGVLGSGLWGVGRRGRQRVHGRVSLGGGRGRVLVLRRVEAAGAGSRQVGLVMRPHGILDAGVGIVGVVHGDVAAGVGGERRGGGMEAAGAAVVVSAQPRERGLELERERELAVVLMLVLVLVLMLRLRLLLMMLMLMLMLMVVAQ